MTTKSLQVITRKQEVFSKNHLLTTKKYPSCLCLISKYGIIHQRIPPMSLIEE